MALTSSQQEAARKLVDFILEPSSNELILTGPGGAGKSHLIAWFLNEGYGCYLKECEKRREEPLYPAPPIVTATTHKAADVLGNNLGRYVGTIHSFLGLKLKENEDIGEYDLVPTEKSIIKYNQIIFIDECSMISSLLYGYIQKYLYNCKIIYVGDKYQLAPPKSGLSPVFDGYIPQIELTENVRLKNHVELLSLADQLRTTVRTQVFKPIKEYKGVIEYLDDKSMKEKIDSLFLEPNKENKIVTYTNARSLMYNEYIKYDLRHFNNMFTEGENYIVNSAVVEEDLVKFSTDETITIKNVGDCLQYVGSGYSINLVRLVAEGFRGEFEILAPLNALELKTALKIEAKNKNWKAFFYLKRAIVDLRLADSSTVHKAQGSTYKNIFIDLNDLGKCTAYDTASRLLYVACTRATDHVYLYGKLPKRLGGGDEDLLLLGSK